MANKTAPYQLTFAICRRTCQRKRNYVLCFIHTLVYQLQTSRAEGLKSFLIIYKEQAARLCFVPASVVLLFRTLYGTQVFPFVEAKIFDKTLVQVLIY